MITDERISEATSHIVSEFTTVVIKMTDELCHCFNIDGGQLNIAIAMAGIGITAMSALAAYGRPIEDAKQLADKIEELVDQYIVESNESSTP